MLIFKFWLDINYLLKNSNKRQLLSYYLSDRKFLYIYILFQYFFYSTEILIKATNYC